MSSFVPTSNGQRYSFHMLMRVRIDRVVIGAQLIGRTIRKKTIQ